MDEGGLLYWGTLRYVKQGSEMSVYFHKGPTFGVYGWAFLSWGHFITGILLGPLETCKCPVDEYLHRGPAGEPGEGWFAGTFERKEVVYLGSFLGPRGL